MSAGRADPFADTDIDLSDFKKQPATRPKIPAATIREVSEQHRFPSRAAPSSSPHIQQRRRRTGRDKQINIKVTTENADRFRQLADTHFGGALAETFEAALSAFEEKLQRMSR